MNLISVRVCYNVGCFLVVSKFPLLIGHAAVHGQQPALREALWIILSRLSTALP